MDAALTNVVDAGRRAQSGLASCTGTRKNKRSTCGRAALDGIVAPAGYLFANLGFVFFFRHEIGNAPTILSRGFEDGIDLLVIY